MNDVNDNEHQIIGRLAGPFGLTGEMRVVLFDINADFLVKNSVPMTLQINNKVLTPIKWRTIAKAVAMRFIEIPDVNTAETFPKSALFIPSSLLPPSDKDDYPLEELIQFTVCDEEGMNYGIITAIYNFGASDIIDLTTNDNKTIMIPLLEEFIIKIDFENKSLIVSSDIKKFF